MPRKNKSKQPPRISEKTREEDERLRRELEQADPEKFKRAVRPLFRSSPRGDSDRDGRPVPAVERGRG